MWMGWSASSGSALTRPDNDTIAARTTRLMRRLRRRALELTWRDNGVNPLGGAGREIEQTRVQVAGQTERGRGSRIARDHNRLICFGELPIGIDLQGWTREFERIVRFIAPQMYVSTEVH